MMARLDSSARTVAGSSRSRSLASALRSSAIASSCGVASVRVVLTAPDPVAGTVAFDAAMLRGSSAPCREGACAWVAPSRAAPLGGACATVGPILDARPESFISANTPAPERRATARHAATSWGREKENRPPQKPVRSRPDSLARAGLASCDGTERSRPVAMLDSRRDQSSAGTEASGRLRARSRTAMRSSTADEHSVQRRRCCSSASRSGRLSSSSTYSDRRSIQGSCITSLPSSRQVFAQDHPRPVKLCLGSAGGNPQHFSDFLVLISLDVVEDEHRLGPFGEPFHGALEVHAQIGPDGPGRQGVHDPFLVGEPLLLGPERGAPREDHVDGEPVEPGPEGRFATEGGQLFPGPEEDVLGDVHRRLARRHAARQVEDTGGMRPVQASERTDVAVGGKGYVFSVLRPGWRHFRVLARCHDSAARVAHFAPLDRKGPLGVGMGERPSGVPTISPGTPSYVLRRAPSSPAAPAFETRSRLLRPASWPPSLHSRAPRAGGECLKHHPPHRSYCAREGASARLHPGSIPREGSSMRVILLALFVAVPAWATAPAIAQPPDSTRVGSHADAPQIHALQTSERIKVDGKLDEEVWSRAQAVDQFTQRDPEEGKPVSERTEVRILIGEDELYVGARLYDREPGKIRRRLVRRDEDLASDYLAVLLDSYHDHLTTYRFRVNPAGSYDDSYIDSRGNADLSWDPVWEVHTTIDSLGWTAEMEIPLSQLHYSPGSDCAFGIQMRRWIDRKQELAEFSFVPKKEMSDASRYGNLVHLGQLPSPKHLEVLPYSLAKAHYHKVDAGDPFQNGSDRVGSLGADLKYGLTSNLTLNATVNPDFGQVEVDPAVVNLSAFETFFPERRPFFIEGADLFRFGVTRSYNYFNTTLPFHARRVGRKPSLTLSGLNYGFVNAPSQTTIDAAVKMTGKTKKGWSIGFLDALTSEEHARFVDTLGVEQKSSVEPLTNYTVARLSRELQNGNTVVGGILTGVVRDLKDPALKSLLRSNAYAGGLDLNHYWGRRRWSLDAMLAGSYIKGSASAIDRAQRSSARYYQRPDATHLDYDPTRTSLAGGATQLSLNKIGGEHWVGSLTYQDWSPGFEINDVGYLSGVDSRGYSTLLLYKDNKPKKLLRSWDAFAFTNQSTNHGGDLTYQGYETQGEWTFSNYWWANSRISWYPTAFDDRLTRGGPMARIPNGARWNLTIGSDTRKNLQFNGQANYTWNDAGGHSQAYTPVVSIHPSPSVFVQ